jgi:hypothetical protein
MAKKGSLKRKAVGAGALGLVALGIWLGQYFPGFGLGKGLGFGTGSSDSGGGPATGIQETRTGDPAANVAGPGTPAQPAAIPPQRLRVIIDGEQFILASGETGHQGQVLDATEIAQRAKSATGDDQGIRIRIERTKNATAGARQTLFEALDAAGITRDARHESTDFLDPVR